MSRIERRELGASEVIGAVLLVSIVVIGGAVIAAFVFGQPTPKEVPHVEFGVSLNDSADELTLHHTGGDTLLPGEYHILVDGVDKTGNTSGRDQPWTSDGNLVVTNVTQSPGTVVLTYLDKASGETVLRRVPFEDRVLLGVISGTKYNVTGGTRVPWSADDPTVTITIYRKEGSSYTGVYSAPVDANGRYSYTLPVDAWGVYKVEESCPGYDPVQPPHGWRQVDVSTASPSAQVDFENRLLVVETTQTPKPTKTVTVTASPTPTLSPVPSTSISGMKYRVDENNERIGGVGGITIKIELVSPASLLPILEQNYGFSNKGVRTTVTAADGSYSFQVPDVPATYRLSETDGLDTKTWWIQGDAEGAADGIINGVVPGATDQYFNNYMVPADGIVMYLNKTVVPGCDGGYVVDGTTLEGEARRNDEVTFVIGGVEQTYTFSSGEQFKFTIAGDQDEGEVMIDHFAMTSLTFNVKFEVRPDRNSAWRNPVSTKRNAEFNTGNQVVTGVPVSVSIDAINKNLLNEDSTLAYRHPVCSDDRTHLRLNGDIRIDSDSDDTYLEFTDLHEVHDNRYGEGLNTMWIYLKPGYDYILAQGVCVHP